VAAPTQIDLATFLALLSPFFLLPFTPFEFFTLLAGCCINACSRTWLLSHYRCITLFSRPPFSGDYPADAGTGAMNNPYLGTTSPIGRHILKNTDSLTFRNPKNNQRFKAKRDGCHCLGMSHLLE
jgi:hypothetical protein